MICFFFFLRSNTINTFTRTYHTYIKNRTDHSIFDIRKTLPRCHRRATYSYSLQTLEKRIFPIPPSLPPSTHLFSLVRQGKYWSLSISRARTRASNLLSRRVVVRYIGSSFSPLYCYCPVHVDMSADI